MRARLALILVLAVTTVACAAGRIRRTPPGSLGKLEGGGLATFAERLEVQPGDSYRALTLYPVVASGVRVPGVDLTLDEAVNRDLLEVDELTQSDMNHLLVTNHAKEPVFAMSGEMLRGGKQDRIIADDLVIPAKSGLKVAVYCVEHGRWTVSEGAGGLRGRGAFTAGHSLAGAGVRAAGGLGGGGRGGGQSAVWATVAEQSQALRARSVTGALRAVHDSTEVRARMRPYQEAFSGLLDNNPRASGVVAVVAGQILAADLFSSRSVFRHMWPQLLEAYVIDALERAGAHRQEAPLKPRTAASWVERWLRTVRTADRTAQETPGEGTLYLLRGREVAGSALLWQNAVVHLGLFPAGAVRPLEEEAPRYNQQEFRRDRLTR